MAGEAITGSGDGLGDLTASDLLESMMMDSVGADNPMTDEAMLVAGAEVTLRLETAQKVLDGSIGQIDELDTKALTALFLIQREAGAFDHKPE